MSCASTPGDDGTLERRSLLEGVEEDCSLEDGLAAGQQTRRPLGRYAQVITGSLVAAALAVALCASRSSAPSGPRAVNLSRSAPQVAQEYYANGYSGTASGYGVGSGAYYGVYDPYNDPAAYANVPAAQGAQPYPPAVAPGEPAPYSNPAAYMGNVYPSPAPYAAPYGNPAPYAAPPAEVGSVPAVQKCSFANEDCHETRCCSNVECDDTYQDCKGYTCYKKDQFDGGFAGCKLSPPADWLGSVLGGPIEPREIEKAPGGAQTQGTSLFCISVVTAGAPREGWQDPESELAENWKRRGQGILQCDDHMIIDGQPASDSSWGSSANIDVFMAYWEQVHSNGRYRNHDWVVKADPDAVFFPDRLKAHLDALRTPMGARVLLLNNAYKFQFLGALEVLTRQALDLYFENTDRCSAMGGHTGGEDFYFKSCWLGIGIDKQTDFELLHDKYAAQNGCSEAWPAAFHFFKKVGDWNDCYDQAVSAASQAPA